METYKIPCVDSHAVLVDTMRQANPGDKIILPTLYIFKEAVRIHQRLCPTKRLVLRIEKEYRYKFLALIAAYLLGIAIHAVLAFPGKL